MIQTKIEKRAPNEYLILFTDETTSNEDVFIEFHKIISKTDKPCVYAVKVDAYTKCAFSKRFNTSTHNPKEYEICITGAEGYKAKVSKLIKDFEDSQIKVKDIPPHFSEPQGYFDRLVDEAMK